MAGTTQHVNRIHGRVGHVFQGRYKAILVERDSYLLELARYVVLNPVRAGMVKDAGQWSWGSYAATVGEAVPPPWLQTDWILGQFALSRADAVRHYMDFVRAGVGLRGVWGGLQGQVYLGSETFMLQMQALSDKADIAEIPRAQRRPLAKPLPHYRDYSLAGPHAAMAAAYMTGDYTMQQIAECFGVHYATVSRAVRRWEKMRECKTPCILNSPPRRHRATRTTGMRRAWQAASSRSRLDAAMPLPARAGRQSRRCCRRML